MKNEELKILQKKFKKIAEKGYVEDKGDKKIGITQTFNDLVSKDFKREFKDIEIKVKKDYTSKYVELFKATPLGKEVNQIKRIRNKYGYPESDENRKKIFFGTVQANASTFINGKLFRLKVDYDKEKIYLLILEKDFALIDDKAYWDFADLEKKYKRRKKYLFIIKAWEKREQDKVFYKYYDYYVLKLKDFKEFLKLLEQGIIRVNFKIDVHKKGPKVGDIDDKGTTFEVEELDLEKLYEKIQE